MAYQDTPTNVPARMHCTTALGVLADAKEVYDIELNRTQHSINESLTTKVDALESLVGEGTDPSVIPVEDSVSAVTVEVDTVAMCKGNATNLAITMQLPNDLHNKAYIYTILFKTTNSSANVTFAHSQSDYNFQINFPSEFNVEVGVWNEIQVLLCAMDENSEFFVRSVKY